MHPALQLAEILLNIFDHWNAHSRDGRQALESADLAALARTCRLFKEPALNVLWSKLADLTPLARCLPQVCYPLHRGSKTYRFRRPLEQAEWVTLLSYTHRVCSIEQFDSTFLSHDVEVFLHLPTPDLLFPNLCHLSSLCWSNNPTPLLYHPLPSLISVAYDFESEFLLEGYLAPFPGDSPKLRKITMCLPNSEATIGLVVSNLICRWPDPRIFSCPQATLTMDAFKHFSRVSDLTQLSFKLDTKIADHSDVLCFNKLQELGLRCKSLTTISNLLSRIQLPAITDLIVGPEDIPSKQNVASFWEVLQTSGVCNSITTLRLLQEPALDDLSTSTSGSDDVLVGDDLRPLVEFKNLRRLDFNLAWKVGLADKDMVELVSAWPHLEDLFINRWWGWRQTSELRGITPDGIIHLLQTCRSLNRLALAIDTRNSVAAPLGLDLSRSLSIDILDSSIEAASVPTMVTFFTHFKHLMPSGTLLLKGWDRSEWWDESVVHPQRWQHVILQTQVPAEEDVKLRIRVRAISL